MLELGLRHVQAGLPRPVYCPLRNPDTTMTGTPGSGSSRCSEAARPSVAGTPLPTGSTRSETPAVAACQKRHRGIDRQDVTVSPPRASDSRTISDPWSFFQMQYPQLMSILSHKQIMCGRPQSLQHIRVKTRYTTAICTTGHAASRCDKSALQAAEISAASTVRPVRAVENAE